MVDEIVKNTKEATKILMDVREMPKETLKKENLLPMLRNVINRKLMIQEEESNIRRLVIISIKKQDTENENISDEVIQRGISKYDCHQTSLVTQKKVLLFLFMERELGIRLEDDEATSIETLEELTEAFMRHLKEGA